MASSAAGGGVRESQQTIADLFGRFSEGMQQLLRAGDLSEPDRESIQRTREIVDGVAQRYFTTAHQSITLEQRSIDHLRHTVEMLLSLKEKEVMLAERELSALCEAAKVLRLDLQRIFPASSSSAALPAFHMPEISDADLTQLISIFEVVFDHENPTFEERQQECFEKVLEAYDKGDVTKIEACKRSLATLRNQSGQTIFLYAVLLGKTELVRILIEQERALKRNTVINSTDRDGNTALHFAAGNGDVVLIALLWTHIPINKKNNYGQTPLHTAILSGQAEGVKAIVENSASLSFPWDWKSLKLTPLALAALRGEITCVKILLTKVPISNADTSIGNILHLVVYFQQNEMLEFLLSNYWETCKKILETQNLEGLTPLAFAAFVDNPQAVSILKKRGANLEAENREGRRPLHLAALTDNHPMVEILVKLGCTIAPRAGGKTPCDLAPENSSTKALLGNLMEQDVVDRSAEPQFRYLPPQNLVFKGGGAKGIAYIGALQTLRKEDVFGEVQRFAGTSAGAIIATLLAMNFSLEELEGLLSTTDLTAFLDHPLSSTEKVKAAIKEKVSVSSAFKFFSYIIRGIKSPIHLAIEPLKAMFKGLWTTTGICEGEAFRAWIDAQIEKKTGKKNCTFGELQQLVLQGRGFKHLHVFAMQLSALEVFHFNSFEKRWKNLVISSAVTASMSIPFVFKPVVLKVKEKEGAIPKSWGDLGTFVDGGVLCNFPIEAFDQKRYIFSGVSAAEGLCPMFNKRTLGFSLVSAQENIPELGSIETVGDLAIGLIKAFRYAESILRQMNPYNQHRVIEIDSKGIGPLDFNLSAAQKSALILSGQQTTLDFFRRQRGIVPSASLFHMPKPAEVEGFYAPPELEEFVGRKELLSTIHAAIPNQPVLLYGHGGIGKSELALAYAHEHRSEYSLVFSLRAETSETLEQSYRGLASLLKIYIENAKLEEIIEKVHRELELRESWLLIYDNVETAIPLPKGRILLTSRQKLTGFSQEPLALEVPLFAESEAVELLQKITGENASQDMHQLASRLGCYPLILGQVARYIQRHEHLDMSRYLAECDAQRLDFQRMDPSERYSKTLRAVLQQILPHLKPLEIQWLHICAYLNPDGIPLHFLEKWLETILSEEENLLGTRDDMLTTLCTRQRLFRYNIATKTFSIHRLFQKVLVEDEVRDEEEAPPAAAAAAAAGGASTSYIQACQLCLQLWRKIDLHDIRDWEVMISHAVELFSHSFFLMSDPKFATLSAEDQAVFYERIGSLYYLQGKYQEALAKHERALEICQTSLDPNHPYIAICLTNIGRCLESQGKHQEALEKYQRALEIFQTSLYPNHPHIVMSLYNIGTCLESQGKYQEALEHYQRALEIQQKSLDPNHPHIATNLYGIGSCLESQGKYQEALEMHQRALTIRQKSLDPNHPHIATSLNNIGRCLESQGKYQEALEKHQRALEIKQKSLDPNHPDIAISLNNFGRCLYFLGKFKEAATRFNEAFLIAKASLGEEHPYTQLYLRNQSSCTSFKAITLWLLWKIF